MTVAYSFEQTKDGYAKMWREAKVLPKHEADAAHEAKRIVANRAVFEQVEQATGVPWYMVGCLLYRESNTNLSTYLGNGQPLHLVTTVVPKGRGPFPSFLAGAIDALKLQGMTGIKDWPVELILYWAERFNGQGYFSHGNSPYIWGWTDQYTGGLFVADHDYRANVWDERGGVAAILKSLETSGIVQFTSIAAPVAPSPKETPVAITPVPAAAGGLPFATIEHVIQGAIPFLRTMFPQLSPEIDLATEILKLADDVVAAQGDPAKIAGAVISHLQAIAPLAQALLAHKQAAPAVAPPAS